MKLGLRFKQIFLWTCALVYYSGLIDWILSLYYQIDNGNGLEPSPYHTTVLHLHAIAGFILLALFGYLYRVHIEPGFEENKRRKSGLPLLTAFIVLFGTIPFLFYLTDAPSRLIAGKFHTTLGILAIVPFVIHLWGKKNRR